MIMEEFSKPLRREERCETYPCRVDARGGARPKRIRGRASYRLFGSHTVREDREVIRKEVPDREASGSIARREGETHVEEEGVDALEVPFSVGDDGRRERFLDVRQLLYTAHIRIVVRPFLLLVVHVLWLGIEENRWDQESTFARGRPGVFLFRMSESRHKEMKSGFPYALRAKVCLDVDFTDD